MYLYSSVIKPKNTYDKGIADNPYKDSANASEKALLQQIVNNTGETYASVVFDLPKPIEGERPIYVSLKYTKTYTPVGTETFANHSAMWVMKNGANFIASSFGGHVNDGTWKSKGELINFGAATQAGNSANISTGSTT